MSYRLGVANIYELLSDDNGQAIAAVKASDQKKSEPAPTAKVQTKAATSSTSSSQQQSKPKATKPQTDRKNDRPQSTEGKGPQQRRDNRPPRLEGSSNDQALEDSERRRPRPEGARGPRGEGRPRREGGPNESSDGFRGPSNKRVFDRKSGTGRGREYNKKGGSGKGNWGTVTDDRQAQEEGAKEEETEETKVEGEKAAESQDAEKKDTEVKAEEKQAEPDPDEKLKTLDEYLKEVKKPVLGLPQPRKPGEGEKNAAWSDYVPLKRDDESSQDSPKGEKRNKEAKSSAVRVDDVIDIKFPQEERRGFGRGRGSDRGQRKGGSGRGQRQNRQSAPNFQDESSFPALSTKA